MSYQPHTWIDQEIIRDRWLNHLEQGVADMETELTEKISEVQTNLEAEIIESGGDSSQAIINERDRAMNAEAAIRADIPTKTSQLTNDSGYLSYSTIDTAAVTGIKGEEETEYRQGDVTITKSDIGLTYTENKSSETIRGELTKQNVINALGYTPGAASDIPTSYVSGVKGNNESSYRTGNVNITKANIGLGNVDNTADSNKSVSYASSAGSANYATYDQSGNNIKSSYGASLGVSGSTLYLYNKNGSSLSNVTIPGSTKIGTSRSGATDTTLYFIRS